MGGWGEGDSRWDLSAGGRDDKGRSEDGIRVVAGTSLR
jgi:hypothetical protein